MELSKLAVDVQKQDEGDWIDIPDLPGLRVKTRSLHAPAYQAMNNKLTRRLARKHQRGSVPPEKANRALAVCLIETCLLDWSGLLDDGKPVAYSKDTAKKLLFDRQYRPLLDACVWAASRVGEPEGDSDDLDDLDLDLGLDSDLGGDGEGEAAAYDEEGEGNSSASSAGPSSTARRKSAS